MYRQKFGARSTPSVLNPHAWRRRSKIRAVGFNTDADAIVAALREDLKMELRGAKVLLLGAGGAGRTAALKLAAEKVAELFLVNRTLAKPKRWRLKSKNNFLSVRVTVGYPEIEVDLLINATSLGLKPGDACRSMENNFH